MAQPSSVEQPISPASRDLYRVLNTYLYEVKDPTESAALTDYINQSAASLQLLPSPEGQHNLLPPAHPAVVDDIDQTTGSPQPLSNPRPTALPVMDTVSQSSSSRYSSPYLPDYDRNSPLNNSHTASDTGIRGGEYQPHENFTLPRATTNAPFSSIGQLPFGTQIKKTANAVSRPPYSRSPACEDGCHECQPGCPDDCMNHCGPRTHVSPFRPGQKLRKLITIFVSPFEVLQPGFLCQDSDCPLTVHHVAGCYNFQRGQRGGTVSLAPPDILDAMERMEKGEEGEEERMLVEWFKFVHEGCDYAIKVEREEYEIEEVESKLLSTLNERRGLDAMFGDERVLDEAFISSGGSG
ncbi:MAG: hypothetical protein LQ346_008453 [Caloplaca aetnensis]|nr:MAG: hypothetical protein LQ346_008453 [Caloplaca aetnensis]